jgi:hypothetical protein
MIAGCVPAQRHHLSFGGMQAAIMAFAGLADLG